MVNARTRNGASDVQRHRGACTTVTLGAGVLGEEDPRRQTRNWFRAGSRRPDAIVVNDPSQPWSGDNIAGLIECKWGKDSMADDQRDAYERIAGGSPKVVELNDNNCKCPEDEHEKEKVPVVASKPTEEEEMERTSSPFGAVAGVLAGVALVAGAIAYVAGAPITVPATAVAAAAAFCVGALGSDGGAASPNGA